MLCPTDVTTVTDYWKMLKPEDHEWEHLGVRPTVEKALLQQLYREYFTDEIAPLETTIDVKYVISRTDPWSLILIYEKDSQRWLSAYKLAPLAFADKEDEDRDKTYVWFEFLPESPEKDFLSNLLQS
ncbi:unnamed protein product [Cladocopium goreaui]|uniref:Uncharacterized protein n=1 Tax=Cladocopium goreaui TaxID=2562237 RepID=A0A9P1BXV3_9DINO|nr:unnamed protein product [Cladocopium goreaui]